MQKVEIAAEVGLRYMVQEKLAVASRISRRRLGTGGEAAGGFVLRHMERQLPASDVEPVAPYTKAMP